MSTEKRGSQAHVDSVQGNEEQKQQPLLAPETPLMPRVPLIADAALSQSGELRSLFELEVPPGRAVWRRAATVRLSLLALALAAALATSALVRLTLGGPAQIELAWLACGSAVGLMLLLGLMKWRPWPADLVPPFVLLVSLVGLLNVLADVVIFSRPDAGMFLPMLLLAAAGSVLAWEWFVLIAAVHLGCWSIIVNGGCAEPQWLTYIPLQAAGLGLGALWLQARRTVATELQQALERQRDLELAAVEAERQERALRTRVRLMESQIRDVRVEREQRERQRLATEQRIEELRVALREQEAATAAAVAEREALAFEAAATRAAASEEIAKGRQELAVLQDELARSSAAEAQLRAQVTEQAGLAAQLAQARRALASSETRLQQLEAELATEHSRKAEVARLTQELDHSRQKLAEAVNAARRWQAALSGVFENLPLGCLWLQRDGSVVFANPRARSWLGQRSLVELINFRGPPTKKTRGHPWRELWHLVERQGCWQWDNVTWPGTGDAPPRRISETYLLLPGDDEPILCVLIEDRGASAELDALRNQIHKLSADLEQARSVTPSASEMWTYHPSAQQWHWPQAVQTTLADMPPLVQPLAEAEKWIHPEDHSSLQAALAGTASFPLDLRLLTSAGKYRWHRLQACRAPSASGTEPWVGTLVDVHELRTSRDEAQERLTRLQQQSWPTQFCLQFLGAEVKSFLTLQLDLAEQLVSTAADGPERLRTVTQVRRLAEHLRQLSQNVLDLAQCEADSVDVQAQSVPLVKLLQETMNQMGRATLGREIKCDLHCPTWLPRLLYRDPHHLRRLLSLLSRVAIQQSNAGTVSWTWKMVTGEHSSLIATLTDAGCGIAPADLELILAPRLSTSTEIWRRAGGVGVALRLAWHLTRLVGGSLDVRPAAPHGLVYEVHWPLLPEETLDLIPGDQVLVPPRSLPSIEEQFGIKRLRGRVLLADDNKDNQLVLGCYLDRLGVEVDTCVSVEEARHLLHDHRYDVILLDGRLPDSEGLQALRLVREENPGVRVVVLEPHVSTTTTSAYLAGGAAEVLSKPVDLVSLFLTLARFLPVREQTSEMNNAPTPPPLQSLYHEDREFRGLLREFVRSLPERTSALRAALSAADLARVVKLAHELKGAARLCGYPQLAEATSLLEQAAVSEVNASRLRELLLQVEQVSRCCERGLARID